MAFFYGLFFPLMARLASAWEYTAMSGITPQMSDNNKDGRATPSEELNEF